MGRKYKQRMIPEQDRRICGSICLCQLTIVLSCVAIVYLSVAIYMPSYNTHLWAVCCGGSCAILKDDICSISSDCGVNLWTEPTGPGQAPFTTARPGTIVCHCGVDGLAHDGFWLKARLKSSGQIKDKNGIFCNEFEGEALSGCVTSNRHPHVYSSPVFLLITTPTNSPHTLNLFDINGAF
uniref:Uncharacterized protein n=1 Tax=Phlebotomus papatasi TaxID=29031 RepID=A0A1B0GPE9_PHLPP